MLRSLIRKYRAQLGDSIYSIAGLLLMNAVMQLALFPFLAGRMGDAGFGDMQYLMAYVNIITVSVGCAANLARMTSPEDSRLRDNGDYHLFLLAVCLLGIPTVLLIALFGGVRMSVPETVSYYFLFVFMALRYYADVAFKLTLNYRRYFLYYFLIGAGYGVGILLFRATGIWPLAILPGEALGILYAYVQSGTLRRNALRLSPAWRHVLRVILLLTLSEGISNLIFNADRLMLKLLIDEVAVTVYYLATLVGKTMSLVTTPLCGVLIGYLARYDGGLGRRAARRILLGALLAVAVCTGVCVVGGWIVLRLLYPDQYEAVRPYLLLGSLAQVIFFTTSILTVILIRFARKIHQIYINGTFGVCFFGLGIPMTLYGGVRGFAFAMLLSNIIRFGAAALLLLLHAHKSDREVGP